MAVLFWEDSRPQIQALINLKTARAVYDYWIIKLDASGNKLWDKTFGGSDNDQLYALQQTKDKGYVLAGYSYSTRSGDKTEPLRNKYGSPDYWVVKTDSLGLLEWDKTIGGSASDQVSDIKQATANDYIVTGLSSSPKSGDKTLPRLDVYSDGMAGTVAGFAAGCNCNTKH